MPVMNFPANHLFLKEGILMFFKLKTIAKNKKMKEDKNLKPVKPI